MRTCTFEGCTVDETGKCALEKDPETCPNRAPAHETVEASEPDDERTPPEAAGSAVLPRPPAAASFPRSTTLGTEAIHKMMGARYVNVVGILGEPESGKTACLVGLYLLVSNGRLKGWDYADSESLMAFEESSRGARRWNNGNPPEQMTVHTQMADDRQPGFLHLGLVRLADGARIDFALPDLPGEWTKALIRSSTSERLTFLRSADVIWVVVDGRTLMSVEKRHGLINRIGILAARLQAMLDGARPRLLLVITHRDGGETPVDVIERIRQEVARHGFELQPVQVAPFSDNEAIKPGHGLSELLDATVQEPASRIVLWPSATTEHLTRAFLKHRSHR